MSEEYVLWTAKIEPNACNLSEFEGFDKVFALQQGLPQGEDFPSGVTMQMDARKPTDTLLMDNLRNIHGVVVVSSKLKDFVHDHTIRELEFLPVTILDHKARPVDREFFIMNPVNNPDCLDLEMCEPVWSRIDDTVIQKVTRLAIQSEWDGADRQIFRPKYYRARPFISASLAKEIENAGFSGVRWEPVSEVTGRLT